MLAVDRLWAWLSQIGMPSPSNSGTVTMRHRDGIDVVIEARPEMPLAHAYSVVAELTHLASARRSVAVEASLRWNLSEAAHDGATLGLHRESGRIILSRAFDPGQLCAEDFAQMLTQFVDTATGVRRALSMGEAPVEGGLAEHAFWNGMGTIRV